MTAKANRLGAESPRGFAGSWIDRSRPLQFRLDGRVVSGFAGDSVLSAALASGIDTVGSHDGQPIGLVERGAPVIAPAADPHRILPMARTPAIDGAEFVTVGRARGAGWWNLFQSSRTLGLSLDRAHALGQPWRSLPGTACPAGDLVVVGGGVAGMSAALAAARLGLAVTLVEASPRLGGHSGLFGTQGDEEAPEQCMARLVAEVTANNAITVITNAEAYAIRAGRVRIHHVVAQERAPEGEVVDLDAPRIVLATGSLERLPIFSGNRLPGVVGTLEAYELATRYGIWSGSNALVATASTFAYRLAMRASDAGISVMRILDTRPTPASRFIEFSRAYGIVQASGTMPQTVTIGRSGTLAVSMGGASKPMTTERLIVCGGWQPDLTLWHLAGGNSRWNSARHRLEADGLLNGISLAGSAAGFLTRTVAMLSGTDAIDALLNRPRQPIDDQTIDPLYETADAPCPVAPLAQDGGSYLDTGMQLLTRPHPPRAKWANPFVRSPTPAGVTALSEAPRPLAICEVAAGVDLGLIPEAAAGTVAQERVALVPLALPIAETSSITTPIGPEDIPPYIQGRFGPDAGIVHLSIEAGRRLEPGTLIYLSPEVDQPLMAVGVMLRQVEEDTIALIAQPAIHASLPLYLREQGRAVSALITKPKT